MVDLSAVFSAIAAIAAAGSALVSLRQQITSKRIAADVRKINNETLWYNKIALDTIVTQSNELIDRAERNIEECKKNPSEIKTRLENLNKELNSDINSLNELLFLVKIFDENLFINCSKRLEEIRDIYSQVINKSLEKNSIIFYSVNDIHTKKKEIVEELWKYAKIVTGQ